MVDAQEMRQKHSSKAETRTQETGKLNDHPRQEVHTRVPGTQDCAAVHGKRDWADWLNSGCWDGEGTMDYLGRPKVTTGPTRRQEEQTQRRWCTDGNRRRNDVTRSHTQARGHRQPVEARYGRHWASPRASNTLTLATETDLGPLTSWVVRKCICRN